MNLDDLKTNTVSKITEDFEKIVDIYVKQRNGKKCITSIYGLGEDNELLKSYSKDLRKLINCSCSIDNDEEANKCFLKLSGKDTEKICRYLLDNLKIKKENIKVHGV